MSEKNTVIRSMHDVGLATWFGGSLMGAVGVNGAAAAAKDPTERGHLAWVGWGKWAPVVSAAIGVHAIGGAGLILANRGRIAGQPGVASNTLWKAGLTVLAAGVTAYSGKLGRDVDRLSREGVEGATEPAATSSKELASAQRQLKAAQWVIPALTGTIVVMGAVQGEQQRPQSLVRNQLSRFSS